MSSSLKFFQRLIQLSSEGNLIKLIQNSFMKPLTDTICLRMTRFGLCMLNAIHAEIEFIIMGLNPAAVLCASVCQHADEPMFIEEKKGSNRSFNKSAPVMGALVVYSLAAAHLEYVSTKVCW